MSTARRPPTKNRSRPGSRGTINSTSPAASSSLAFLTASNRLSSSSDSHSYSLADTEDRSPRAPFFISSAGSDSETDGPPYYLGNAYPMKRTNRSNTSDGQRMRPSPPATATAGASDTRQRVADPFADDAQAQGAANNYEELGWNPAALYDAADAFPSIAPTGATASSVMSAGRSSPVNTRPSGESVPVQHSLSTVTREVRPPPSSFAFPFQQYPGNPDPLPRRRSPPSRTSSVGGFSDEPSPRSDLSQPEVLPPPIAPFMSDHGHSGGNGQGSHYGSPSNSMYSSTIYRSSSAGNLHNPALAHQASSQNLPGSPATPSFRAPFLSPISRPTSSMGGWVPPSVTRFNGEDQEMLDPAGSTTSLALPGPKPPMPSNLLEHKLDTEDKPWMRGSDRRQKISWWLTLCGILLGALGAAAVCYLGYTSVYVLPAQYTCKLLLDEDFSGSTLNTDTWHYDVELGGFNDGEFEITTDNDTNVFIKNNQLYIKPTLTSDVLSGGYSALFDGGSYDLGSSCSTSNTTACSVTADNSTGTVVNPVMSGRLTTRGLVSMQYGRIEVRAKLPRGDWLWPSIWMLPENDADEDENWSGDYGDWPLSGEIDIMSSRGNGVNYKGRGCNYVQGALTYGVMDSLIETLYGWWSLKQSTYADDFHTYAIEWDPDFMRFYTDTRLDDILTVVTKTEKQSFWTRGSFPEVTQNGSSEVVVVNPWKNDGYNAPFNKPFYLIIDLAVGGTNGWFPDNEGGKPWYDGSSSAMYDFAKAQDTWYANWPTDEDDLSFRIDSVKMWTTC